jgi:hypothetical protein
VCVRQASAWELPVFHCARHAGGTDLPLPDVRAFRRVRLMAVVDFAGVTTRKGPAEAEAIELLERLVADGGGLLSNVSPASAIVRHRAYGGDSSANGDKGKG